MNKKGFTLIELLAVIVILAIIALIATPVVLNIIEDSKESAAKDSAMVIAKAAETHYISNVTLQGQEVGTIDLTGDTLEYKGEKPEKGYVEFDDKGNSYLKMYMNGYCVVSDYDNTVVSEKMDSEECTVKSLEPLEPYENGDAVYFNPVTNEACKDTDYVIANSANGFRGTKESGCMLWRAFLDNEEAETVKLILDHNTSTSTLDWNQAMAEIADVKDNNLYGWHANVRSTVRLISAYEINKMAPWAEGAWTLDSSIYYLHSGTQSNNASGKGNNKYAWLLDNLEGCISYAGCNVAQNGQMGYWTSSDYDNSEYAWQVTRMGWLYHSMVILSASHGVRPVIEVPRTVLAN